jgi:hypothetical protein
MDKDKDRETLQIISIVGGWSVNIYEETVFYTLQESVIMRVNARRRLPCTVQNVIPTWTRTSQLIITN